MKKQYLEAGRIVNTHGVKGEVRIEPWTDTPGFLCSFSRLFLKNNMPVKVLASQVHNRFVIALLEGVSDINAAMALKGQTVFIDRSDAKLQSGEYFTQDIIGFRVKDAATGTAIGTLQDVLELPAGRVYSVSDGTGERLIPAVPQFVEKVDLDGEEIIVRLIEGM